MICKVRDFFGENKMGDFLVKHEKILFWCKMQSINYLKYAENKVGIFNAKPIFAAAIAKPNNEYQILK